MPTEHRHQNRPACGKGMGPVLQHRLKVPLAFEGGISPFLEASARAPGYPNGWDWLEASCLSAWVSLLVKEGEDTGGASSQMLLALAVLQVVVGGCTPFASLKFSDTALRGLSSSCSSRMRGSPVGKSSGAGFGPCGAERRPVGLHAAGARCPGCWESNGKNTHGAGT